VPDEEYAVRIARDWNVPASGAGDVTRRRQRAVHRPLSGTAGGRTILEPWVPAGELTESNDHVVGVIEVVHEFR
jgi:hypothetical protein